MDASAVVKLPALSPGALGWLDPRFALPEPVWSAAEAPPSCESVLLLPVDALLLGPEAEGPSDVGDAGGEVVVDGAGDAAAPVSTTGAAAAAPVSTAGGAAAAPVSGAGAAAAVAVLDGAAVGALPSAGTLPSAGVAEFEASVVDTCAEALSVGVCGPGVSARALIANRPVSSNAIAVASHQTRRLIRHQIPERSRKPTPSKKSPYS